MNGQSPVLKRMLLGTRHGAVTGLDLLSWNNTGSTAIRYGLTAADFNNLDSNGLYRQSDTALQGGARDLYVCAWVQFNGLTGGNLAIVSKDDNFTKAGSEYLLCYAPASGYNYFTFQIEEPGHLSPNDGTTWVVFSTVTPVPGVLYLLESWYNHVAGSISIQITKGAVSTATGLPNASNTTTTGFSIGCIVSHLTDLPEGSWFNGQIRSVGISHTIPTDALRDELYQSRDLTVAANSGSLTGVPGGVVWSADVPPSISTYTYSTLFNTNGVVQLQSNILLNPENSAIELYFKLNSFGGVVVGNSVNANTYVRVLDATTIRVQTDVIGTYKDYTVPSMSTGVWYKLKVTRNANSTRVYINDVESASGAQTQTDNLTITQIGRYWDFSSGLNFDGWLSDVKFYYGGSASPGIWFKLNEGSGTVTADSGTHVITGIYPPNFNQLSLPFQELFSDYWNLDETSGTRYDSK
jgi:hypothetical protein